VSRTTCPSPPLNRRHIRGLCLTGLCVRRADHGELGGSDGHGGIAQKAAAIMVYFFGHLSLQLAKNGIFPLASD
jgi:hypothetical protein